MSEKSTDDKFPVWVNTNLWPNGGLGKSDALSPKNSVGVACSIKPLPGVGAGGMGAASAMPPTGGGGAGSYSAPPPPKVTEFVAQRWTFGHGESGYVIIAKVDALDGYDYMDEAKVRKVVDQLNAQLKK